jgi:CheY-like chemotaxis protein
MCSILLVEDDNDLAEVEECVLSEAGYQPVRAANGREALELLKTMKQPCVVLLDLMMPELNGWQFLEFAGDKLLHTTPVVVTTAGHFERPPLAKEMLRKPFPLDFLLETVDRYCASAAGMAVRPRIEQQGKQEKSPARAARAG